MSSQWPELMPDGRGRSTSTIVVCAAGAAAGGGIGWTLVFVGLGVWGLLVGLAITGALAVFAGSRSSGAGSMERLALSVAWILLTWPVLWVLAALIRYWITGHTVGN